MSEILQAVEYLASRESNALGFIPRRRYGHYLLTDRLHITSDPKGPINGYVAWGLSTDRAHIHQIVTHKLCRRRKHATNLILDIEDEITARGVNTIILRCASTLRPANAFWDSLNYQHKYTDLTPNTRDRPINCYEAYIPSPAMSYIYILHFSHYLSDHALHYVGVTANLRQRLTRHAQGKGSNICRVLKERGITWDLSAVYQCQPTDARELERLLKRQHNAMRYCPLCSKQPLSLPYATDYPLSAVPFPTTSKELLKCGTNTETEE